MNLDKSHILKRLLPIFTVWLFAIYPVLAWYAHNVEEVVLPEAIFPIILSLTFSTVVFTLFWILLKNSFKAGILTIVLLLFFWNYGLIFLGLKQMGGLFHWHVMPLLLFIYFHLVYFLVKVKDEKVLDNINTICLLPIAVLIVFNLINIIPAEFKKSEARGKSVENEQIRNTTTENKNYPDIYLIILDAFASMNTIQEEWGYNPSMFGSFMKDKGFFIAENSQVRYSQTAWSIPTLLNLEYLTQPIDRRTFLNFVYNIKSLEGTKELEMLKNMSFSKRTKKWNNSLLLSHLKEKGYNIGVLEGVSQHYHTINFENADFHFSYGDNKALKKKSSLTAFHLELLKSSALFPLDHFLQIDQSQHKNYFGTKYIFDYLSNRVEELEGPRFILAHVLCPHNPYVFDAKGNYRTPVAANNYREGAFVVQDNKVNEAYLEQYIYVLNEIKKIVNSNIREKKSDNPVIIIQSDHGPRPHALFLKDHTQAFKIFNAVYFPDGDYQGLYDSIGQVNTMRVVLNKYFDTDFKMLEDK